MSKVLLVYASMTGNTEELANSIEEGVISEGVTVAKKDVSDVGLSLIEEYKKAN